jgi:hypothetical protein
MFANGKKEARAGSLPIEITCSFSQSGIGDAASTLCNGAAKQTPSTKISLDRIIIGHST